MGASGWHYTTGYDRDPNAALRALQQRVFIAEDFEWPGHDDLPATIEDLRQDEWIRQSGTHSILDVVRVIDGTDDQVGAVRLLTDAETRDAFGTTHPTPQQFTAVAARDELLIPEVRWSGYCVHLYDGDQPTMVGFWGISGD